MLATSFGASAQTDFTNGGKYFLKAYNSGYLSVSGDSLKLMPDETFKGLDRFQKEALKWEISYTTNASGEKEYTFKNVESGELLSIADTTGCVFANVNGGFDKFTWGG